jgi:hypothetical protein
MLTRKIALVVACSMLASGCSERPDETREIIDNLIDAGFPANDIRVVDGIVYVGNDAEVSLAASREMVETGGSGREQYRTTNLVSPTLAKICVDGSTFTGVFSTALDRAIQNYEEQPLGFTMARTPSTGCSFTINAVIQPGLVGGSAGFPSGGLPFGTINIGGGLSGFSIDTVEHVITHELGHTIGLRHSDFFNRSISCGSGGDEGQLDVGAIHIPETPTGATVGGSIMNACFRTSETGEFTASDITALMWLYGKVVHAALDGRGAFLGKTYFFRGSKFVRYDWATDDVDPGYPASMSLWNVPGAFVNGIDASLNGVGSFDGKAYFFRGSEFVRYDWASGTVDAGYPLPVSVWNLPGAFASGVDAALEGIGSLDGKAFFFRGNAYVRYDWASGTVDAGYPLPISVWNLPGNFASGIDAAVNGQGAFAGKAFFFRGLEYVRYDWASGTVDAGYPLPISVWNGLDSLW